MKQETTIKRDWKFYWYKFIHNAVIHPLLSLPIDESKFKIGRLILKYHDITAEKCKGAG